MHYSQKRDEDIMHNINLVDAYLKEQKIEKYSQELNWLKLRYKADLINRVQDKRSFFLEQWPEANKKILSAKSLPFNLRLVMWGFAHNIEMFYKIRQCFFSLKRTQK
jgi:type II secretory pathway component PulJ